MSPTWARFFEDKYWMCGQFGMVWCLVQVSLKEIENQPKLCVSVCGRGGRQLGSSSTSIMPWGKLVVLVVHAMPLYF